MVREDQLRTRSAEALRGARERAGLSLRELARRAGTSHATLLAYEKGRKSPGNATFERILAACGYAVIYQLSPLGAAPSMHDRAQELEEVLILSALFPARHARTLDAPIFGRQ